MAVATVLAIQAAALAVESLAPVTDLGLLERYLRICFSDGFGEAEARVVCIGYAELFVGREAGICADMEILLRLIGVVGKKVLISW